MVKPLQSRKIISLIQAKDAAGLRDHFCADIPLDKDEWSAAWVYLLDHPAADQKTMFEAMIHSARDRPILAISAIKDAVMRHRIDLAPLFESGAPEWGYVSMHFQEAVETVANPWISHLYNHPASNPMLAWAGNLARGRSRQLINLSQVWFPDPSAVWREVNPQGNGLFGRNKFPAPEHQRRIENQIDRALSEIAPIPGMRPWVDAFLRAARTDRADLLWPQMAHHDLVKERFRELQGKPAGLSRPRYRS